MNFSRGNSAKAEEGKRVPQRPCCRRRKLAATAAARLQGIEKGKTRKILKLFSPPPYPAALLLPYVAAQPVRVQLASRNVNFGSVL
jgi:hypothetical protein